MHGPGGLVACPPVGENASMKLDEPRPGVFEVTVTAHELSAVLAGARMSLALMESDPSGASEEARIALERVLSDFDAALARRAGGQRG
jgi:hypothetical protein